jgi:hypothetical protein
MAKDKRQVFHSILTKTDRWAVQLDKEILSEHTNQKDSEAAAVEEARGAYKKGGVGQAVFHKSDGTIREEWTYGKDPQKTPA